jgi:hypothetical protein
LFVCRIGSLPFIRAYNADMEHPELVVVQPCGNRLDAELVKGALVAAGIPAMIQGDTVGGMREHLAWSGAGFRILVREEDLTVARELLAAPPDDTEPQADREGLPPWRRFT